MFLKYFKFELKNTYQAIVFITVLNLVLSLVLYLQSFIFEKFNLFTWAVFTGLMLSIATSAILLLVTIIKTLHARLFSKEGYLTLTLPVSHHTILLSKLLVNLLYIVMYYIVLYLCINILIAWGVKVGGGTNEIQVVLTINSFLKNFIISLVTVVSGIILCLTFLLAVLSFVYSGKVRGNKVFIAILLFIGITVGYSSLLSGLRIIPYGVIIEINEYGEYIPRFANIKNGMYFALIDFNQLLFNTASTVLCYWYAHNIINRRMDLL